MTNQEASRTIVKSGPELWAECSDARSLARHLGAFGEIRITRLEPETAVAWEGDAASGTVRLEPSGWGTRVVLTAASGDAHAKSEPGGADSLAEAGPAPPAATGQGEDEIGAPDSEPADDPEAPSGAFARLLGRMGWRRGSERERPTTEHPPTPTEHPPAPTEHPPTPTEHPPAATHRPVTATGALDAALDSLGRAHRRPYSRS